MNVNGYGNIPRELCYLITFLSQELPLRSVRTFIELLIGTMLTPIGFVTEAWHMVDMRNHWTSYFKWLEKGNGPGWRWGDVLHNWP